MNKILRASNNHEKEYIVTVDRRVDHKFCKAMGAGVRILDTVTRECFVEQTGPYEFRIVLTQGLNRQIRRMCDYLGYKVHTLQRVRIMNVKLDVPLGEWRDLSEAELQEIHRLTASSSKTYRPSE